MAARKKPMMTEAQDAAMDRRMGIKQGSKKDNALDRARGVPVRKAPKGKK
jgi:hypothetical protein